MYSALHALNIVTKRFLEQNAGKQVRQIWRGSVPLCMLRNRTYKMNWRPAEHRLGTENARLKCFTRGV